MTRLPVKPAAALALAACAPAWSVSPDTPADLGTAVAAQIACGGVFVAGRDPAAVLRDDVRAMAPFTRKVDIAVDRAKHLVTASAPGAQPRSAFWRPEVGCTLLGPSADVAALREQAEAITPMAGRDNDAPWPLGDAPAAGEPPRIDRDALDGAVAAAFDERNAGGHPDTRALVVVHQGHIVAERYAEGFDRRTPLLGWSAGKSITATVAGLLVDDGRLSLDDPAPVPAWDAPEDPRRGITLRHLLHMTSGLHFGEHYQPGSDVIRMLFAEPDMGGYAAAMPLQHPPGAVWNYSSGTTNLLSRIIRARTGGSLRGMTAYARRKLFEPAGMTSVVWSADLAGVPVGSSYVYATARDWARFGMLYLNEGMAGDRRVLSEGWVAFVRTPDGMAEEGGYGGHFWLNRGDGRPLADLPGDSFFAAGHNGQYIAVIPSRETVIVRLGWTPEGESFDANGYFSRILAALTPG